MDTIKLFAKLLLAFILLYIFVDFMSFAYIRATYNKLDKYTIQTSSPKIEVTESKATYVNGYIIGKVYNNTSSKIDCVYVDVDCFSKYDNNIESRYAKIDNLEVGQTRDFKIEYKCQEVDYLKIYTSETIPEGYHPEPVFDSNYRFAVLLSAMIMLYFM